MLRTDDDVVLDAPGLEKVKVEATVASHELGEKIQVFKYKAKKGYRKRQGHRSSLTRLEVTEVKQLTRKPAAKKDEAPKEEKPKAEAEEPKAEAQEPAVSGAGELPEGLDKPVTEALEGAGLTTLAKVAEKTEDEILELKGIGPKAAEALAEALEAEGLSFKQTDTTGEEE